MQEPLDFEGARGQLSVEARTLNDILGAMGSKTKADLPLRVAGILKRVGGSKLKAAEILGVDPSTLYRREKPKG